MSKRELEYLHGILSRIDIEKDAIYASTSINKQALPFFRNCADELFGAYNFLGGFETSMNEIKSTIKEYLNVNEPSVFPYIVYNKKYTCLIPSYIKYGIYDSGIKPLKYNDNIIYIINPGSYLDPGNRNDNNIEFGFNINLTKRDFITMSFRNIESLNINKTTDRCNINILFKFNNIYKDLTFVFDNSLNIIPHVGDNKYIKGNSTKNTWFNSNNQNIIEAYLYILCKELGDVLQAYYTKILLQKISTLDKRTEIVLFTCDQVLLFKCLLLGVPVAVDYSNLNSVLYYSGMNIINNDIKKHYLDLVKINNETVINNIKEIISLGYYYLPNMSKIIIGSDVLSILNKIINIINSKTTKFQMINSKYITVNEYQQLAECFKAINLFNMDNKIIYPSAQNIFIKPFNNESLFNIINTSLLYQITYTNERTSTGGGTYIISDNYINLNLNTLTDEEKSLISPYIKLKYILYNILKDIYKDTLDETIYFIVDDITNILLIYNNYIGGISLNTDFLTQIIAYYEKNITLSLYDYFDLYSKYNDTRGPLGEEKIKYDISKYFRNNNKTQYKINTRKNIPILVGGKKKRRTRRTNH